MKAMNNEKGIKASKMLCYIKITRTTQSNKMKFLKLIFFKIKKTNK